MTCACTCHNPNNPPSICCSCDCNFDEFPTKKQTIPLEEFMEES